MKNRNPIKTLLALLVIYTSCSSPNLTVQTAPIDASLSTVDGAEVLIGPSVLMVKHRFIWGGSVIEGEDGKYHMFFSTWQCGPDSLTFSDTWLLHSEIGYAVSDFPDRDFKFQKIVLRGRKYDGDSTAWDAQTVHNPHIKHFDQRYYLYYVGSHDPGKQPVGSPGETLSKRNRIQQEQKIGVIVFDHLDDLLNGYFHRPDHPLLAPRTRVKKDNIIQPSPPGTKPGPDNIIVVNPSVVFRPSDQKYLLYFKGNIYDPSWRGIHGVAISGKPDGPFETLDTTVFDIRMPDGKIASAEDPFVWYAPKYHGFYAVVKDFSGTITKDGPGLALLQSENGTIWSQAKTPEFLKKELLLKDGSTIQVDRLERPQLLVNEAGIPEVLYAACSIESVAGKITGGTFNVQIPLQITD